MTRIPLFLLEEHHEAFLAWNYSVMKGWLPAEENTLLHVDEHSDMSVPALDIPIREALNSLEDLVSFTYSQLSVASFLYPALYLGLFSRLYWFRQKHDEDLVPEIQCILSEDGLGKRLRASQVLNLSEALNPDRQCYHLSPITSGYTGTLTGNSIVLDIDLDCFSCDNLQGVDWDIEITKEAYTSFLQDKYNRLKMASGNLVKVKEKDGSYYLCSNYGAVARGNLMVSEDHIRERIHDFVEFLRRNSIQPVLIDIARSRLSGYTPVSQWEFIEKTLLDELSLLYQYDVIAPAELEALP